MFQIPENLAKSSNSESLTDTSAPWTADTLRYRHGCYSQDGLTQKEHLKHGLIFKLIWIIDAKQIKRYNNGKIHIYFSFVGYSRVL